MNDSQSKASWMNTFRILFLLAGIPLVLWLSSMFWYAWLKADWKTVGVFGWLDGALLYWQGDPAALSRSTSIWVTLALALIAVYGVPIYAALTGQIKFGKPKLHGDARFANRREITKAKLNGADPLGVVIGRYNGQVLTFPGQQFVLVAAPTRSGKGVGIVIPNLLSYQGSMVVLDIKQENYDYTAGYRSRVLEQNCWLFNPFADERDENKVAQPRTHRYNFLEAIESPPFRIGDILSLGQSLWPTGGKDSFWNDSARNLFLGIVLVLLELRDAKAGSPWSPDISEAQRDEIPPLPVTMGEVLRQSSGGGSGQPIKKYFKDFFLGKFKHCLSSECLDSLNNFLSASDDTLSNILSTFNAPLAIWRNPVVDAATSACDFQLSDVRKKKMTVFIGVKPKFLDDARVILNVMFSQLVALNTRELPKDNPELKYPCMLLMDEFTAIGKVTIIAKAVSYIAGYNLRLVPIIQSISQLESVYGKEDTRTFTTNHAMQVLYPPKDDKDAKEYSEMLGYYTYKSSSSSRSKSILNPRESSENLSDQRRALLLPQEIKELGIDREIITLENTKAIFCHKIRYYEEADFKDKVEPAPEIPVIDLKIPRVKFDDLAKHPSPAKESDLIGEGTDIRYAPGVEPAGIEDDFESQESQWSQTDSGHRDPVANLGRLVPAKDRPTAEEITQNLKESRSLVAMVASADASVTPKDPSISEAARLKAIASNMALTKADTNTQAEIDPASAHYDVFGEALTESEIQESFEEWQ
jgi:type IV secretion system protein VirD4